jgi:hypothetical protein
MLTCLTACWNEKPHARPTWEALFGDLKVILMEHSSEFEGTSIESLQATINMVIRDSLMNQPNMTVCFTNEL